MNSALELRDRDEPADDRELAPADAFDPVIEAYKRDVDRSLLRENLKLTSQQRSERLVSFMRGLMELRRAEVEFQRDQK